MPVVLKTMPLGAAGRKWQYRIQTVKSLDGALLVNTEYSGVHGRFEIQPDDIGSLLLKLRIIAGHVAPRTVGLESKLPPHSTHRRLTDTQLLSQSIAAPVGRAIGWSTPGQFQDARLSLRGSPSVLGATIAGIQPSQPLLLKALLPPTDLTIRTTELFAYLTIGMTSRQHQNNLRSLNHLRSQRPASCTAFQFLALRRSQYNST